MHASVLMFHRPKLCVTAENMTCSTEIEQSSRDVEPGREMEPQHYAEWHTDGLVVSQS